MALQDDIKRFTLEINESKNNGETLANLQKLEKETANLRKENEDLEKVMGYLASSGKKTSDSYKQMEAQLKTNRITINQNSDSIKGLTKNLDLNYMSMNQLKKRATELQSTLNGMSKAANLDEYTRLEGQLGKISGQMNILKGKTAETGGFMGKLGGKFQSIPGPVGAAASGLMGMGKAMWALVANPIGAVIAAIVASVVLLYKAFKSTDDGATKLEGVFKGLSNVMDILLDRVVSYYKLLWDIVTLDFEGIKKNGKEAFGGLAQSVADAAKAGMDYASTMDDIEDREVAASNRMARLRVEIENLKNATKDKTLTDKQQMEAAQLAIDKEIELNGLETQFLNEKTEAEIKNLASKMQNSKMTMAEKEAQLKQWLSVDDLQLASTLENDKAFADFYNKNSDAFQDLQKKKSEEILKEAELAQNTRKLRGSLSGFIQEKNEERAKSAAETAKKELDILEQQQQKELNTIKQTQLEKNFSDEEYNKILVDQQLKSLTEKLALQKKFKQDTTATEAAILDIKLKQQEEYDKKTEDEKKKAHDQAIKDLDTRLKNELALVKADAVKRGLNEEVTNSILLAKEIEFLEQKLLLTTNSAEEIVAIQTELTNKRTEITANAIKGDAAREKELADLKKKYSDEETIREQEKTDALTELDTITKNGSLVTHEEYERMKTAITEKYGKKRFESEQKFLEGMSGILNIASSLNNAAKDNELRKAGDNAKKREEIEKKYAKKQQKIAIAQAIVNGALGVTRVLADTVDPTGIYKAILVAGVIATTAAEVAEISSQQFATGRYPVRGASDGQLYSAGFVGKPRTGIYKKPSLGLFSERQPEAVIDGLTTERLQWNYPHIWNGITTLAAGGIPQFFDGRYPSGSASSNTQTVVVQQSDPELKALLKYLADNGIQATTNINANEVFSKKLEYDNAVESSEY
jgi:hypothetical protein